MINRPACAGVLKAEPGLYQAKEENLEQCEWSVVVLLRHLR